MSSKVKGLQYQSNEPAFLQRMRAQNTGGDGRHERPVPRPKRGKVDDEDDAPTYVMEETNDNISKKEYEELVSGRAKSGDGDVNGSVTGDVQGDGPVMSGALPDSTKNERSGKVQEAKLGQKKRKAATVIKQDDDEDDSTKQESKPKAKKKKSKPSKLSFDDEE